MCGRKTRSVFSHNGIYLNTHQTDWKPYIIRYKACSVRLINILFCTHCLKLYLILTTESVVCCSLCLLYIFRISNSSFDLIKRYANSSKPGRMIIYMEDEKPIIIPKSRPMGPLGYKFYTHLSEINKKPPSKYVNHTPVRFKLLSYLEEASYDDFNDDIMKKCCRNEWTDIKQEVPHYKIPGEPYSLVINIKTCHVYVWVFVNLEEFF